MAGKYYISFVKRHVRLRTGFFWATTGSRMGLL